MSLDIRSTIRSPAPKGVPFERIAKAALGSTYELSLVLCGDTLAQRMNKRYRQKTYKPNVLSFPISKTEGEIFLNVRCAQREARKYGVSTRERLALLLVHGCLHLKGLDHGGKMEREELRILKMFNFKFLNSNV